MPRNPTVRKRRRTLDALPHLMAYKKPEEEMGSLRICLDPRSRDLLRRLSIAEDVTESTWFSHFAHRLLHEPTLFRHIDKFVQRHGRGFPPTGLGVLRNYSIPWALRAAIDNAAALTKADGIVDGRGSTGPWMRLAFVYLGFMEKGWRPQDLASTPLHEGRPLP